MATSKKNKKFVEFKNARVEAQLQVMKQIEKEGVCPFCPANLKKFHTQPIIKETNNWLLTPNQWPYENTKIHLIIIAKKHVEELGSLNTESWQELGSLLAWAEKKYKIKGGGIGLRFGDTSINNASVRHLHMHILSPDITDKKNIKYRPVHLKVG